MTHYSIKSIYSAILFITLSSALFANPSYKMTIEEIEVVSDTSIKASIYIENVDTEFELTSYQCALGINQNLDLSSLFFYYLDGSSELLNEPNLYYGVDNIDGPTELTFVSYIGNDIISKKTLVGKFILEGKVEISNVNLLNIKWDFDGTISTILTGKDFVNITNPSSHVSLFSNSEEPPACNSVNIVGSSASAESGDKFKASMLYDGIHCNSNGGEYTSNSDGRWAVSGFPQWVTIDLGVDTEIEHIRLDPYGSENGITYDCEFYIGDYENKVLVSASTTSDTGQWSVHDYSGKIARYITVVVTGSDGNDWCDFWELEVHGTNISTNIEENNEVAEVLPTEFALSQNYPNPFNPSTKIQVQMKENGSARLDVYNLLGEKVLAVLDDELSAGVHEISIDGSKLASGVYIYKLDVDNKFSQVKKMNLLK